MKAFFVHKNYYRSFIKLRLNHRCHMDYFTDVLIPLWTLNLVVALLSMRGQKSLGIYQKYLNLSSEDEFTGLE